MGSSPPRSGTPTSVTQKPRVVVTTDPELDDSNSLIRYLLYSTDFRTEGLVYASSQFHWKGDGTGKKWSVPNREYFRFGLNLCPCESWRWAPGERFIDDAVDLYERVYPNLRVHHATIPRPPRCGRRSAGGTWSSTATSRRTRPAPTSFATSCSTTIPAPVYLLAWGGASTIARALKSIQDRYAGTPDWPAIRAKVSRKAILSLSGDQDDTYATYIRPNWPDIRSLPTGRAASASATARSSSPPPRTRRTSARTGRARTSRAEGPFGAHYRVWGDGKQMVKDDRFDYFGLSGQTAAELRAMGYVVWLPPRPKGEFLGEGDTFTFLNLIDNGLRRTATRRRAGGRGRVAVNPASPGAAPRAGAGGRGDVVRGVPAESRGHRPGGSVHASAVTASEFHAGRAERFRRAHELVGDADIRRRQS